MRSPLIRWTGLVLAAILGFCSVSPAQAQYDGGEVTVTVKAAKQAVSPGDQLAIAVVFDHQPGYHIHTNAPVIPPEMGKFEPFETKITVHAPQGVTVWPIQWPEVMTVDVAFGENPAKYGVFGDRAAALIPVQVPETAKPGETLKFVFDLSYQACDDTACLFPMDHTVELELPVVAVGQASGNGADGDFARFDAGVFAKAPTGEAQAQKSKVLEFDAFGIVKFSIDPKGAGLVLLLLAAALGGFLLNLTPCVLPVVPLKIMGLSAAAGNPARCLYLGTVMSLGVIAFWIGIGSAIAFISGFTAINSLFQTPWFSLAVGAFILFMAIGMLGAFAVRLPQFVYLVNPKHETATGSFVFGIMTAVLSTPCTAPFMGSAAAWAATQNPAITLLTFGAIGLGMALPYLILSAFPNMVAKIPRTGPASELVKQIMGLLLVGVAIFFLGTGLDPLLRHPVDPPVRFQWWLIGAVAVGAMVWLVYRTFQITKRPVLRTVWTTFGAGFAAVSVLVVTHFTDRGPIPWIGYTPERLAEQLGKQKVVVLDFTAEWCINCKVLESVVLHRDEIVALLRDPNVVPMKVDLTGNNLPGKAKLKELNWVGIPLLAIYGPKATDPIKYDAYTPEMVKDAIGRAGGPAQPAAAGAGKAVRGPEVARAAGPVR